MVASPEMGPVALTSAAWPHVNDRRARDGTHRCDLLIGGGGIAGSTLAHAMAQTGAHVLVIERETAFGLSPTLRDVRLLRDRLLRDPDWTAAVEACAVDHDDFYHRLRRAEQLNSTLLFSMGDNAEERRKGAFKLMEQHPELDPEVSGLGPEARYSERSANLLLNA